MFKIKKRWKKEKLILMIIILIITIINKNKKVKNVWRMDKGKNWFIKKRIYLR